MGIRDTTYHGWQNIYTNNDYAFDSFCVDSSGSMYILGFPKSSGPGTPNYAVFKSEDVGYKNFTKVATLWTEDEDFWRTPRNTNRNVTNKIRFISGSLYVIGMDTGGQFATASSTVVPHWIVCRSIDGGITWTTVDAYAPGASFSRAMDITCDANGNLFVVGCARISNREYWIIRSASITNHIFSNVDSISQNFGGSAANFGHCIKYYDANGTGNGKIISTGWFYSGSRKSSLCG